MEIGQVYRVVSGFGGLESPFLAGEILVLIGQTYSFYDGENVYTFAVQGTEETKRMAIPIGEGPNACLELIGATTAEAEGTRAMRKAALQHAIESGQAAEARVLMEAGSFDPNDLEEAFGCALTWRQPEIVRYLLGRGANPNARFGSGHSALMSAAFSGVVESVRLLVEAGAKVNAKDDGGWTALDWAKRRSDCADVVTYLEKLTGT